MTERHYTAYDLANMFGVNYKTIMAWVREGKLEASKIGRFYRFNKDQVRSFLLSFGNTPEQAEEFLRK